MSAQRKRSRGEDVEDAADSKPHEKRRKRGFVVGPANLPDGPYKRKTQKIKKSLIDRARIKKDYAKLQRQGQIPTEPVNHPDVAPASLETPVEANTAPHPERQVLIDQEADGQAPETREGPVSGREEAAGRTQKKRAKTVPFRKEYELAQRRKAEAAERQRAREEAERERQSKIEDRDRLRRAMAKARSVGPNGKRKLGRESKILLEKVKRMVAVDE